MSKKTKSIAIFGELLGLGISIIVSIYLVPMLPFVTNDYYLWLPVGIATAVISSVFDIAKYLVDQRYYSGLKALSIVPDIYSVYVLVRIFPFDFSSIGLDSMNSLIRFALAISVFGMVIAFTVRMIKFATYSKEEKGEAGLAGGQKNTSG